MRLRMRRAVRRGLYYVVAAAFCIGPVVTGVSAQEPEPPVAVGPAAIASGGEDVLLREGPGYDAVAVASLNDGGAIEVVGALKIATDGTAWVPVVAGGQSGFVPAGYVGGADAIAPPAAEPAALPEPVMAAPDSPPNPSTLTTTGGSAITTSEANLRAGPGMDFAVMGTLPPGTSVSISGVVENGFLPVSGNGVSGWVSIDLLTESGAAPLAPVAMPEPVAPTNLPEPVTSMPVAEPLTPDPVAAGSESTGISWPISGGEWHVVQGYNGGTHQNRGGFAQYHYSLDWARVDGNTAGQPVYAPASGTIEWTDRGSGGILVDAGNGYGVALFHVTLDGGASRGGSVTRGQQIGTISGPGGDGYMGMAHIEIAAWRLVEGGHESVPFIGPNAIAGMEFPDTGGANQHMGATVTP